MPCADWEDKVVGSAVQHTKEELGVDAGTRHGLAWPGMAAHAYGSTWQPVLRVAGSSRLRLLMPTQL